WWLLKISFSRSPSAARESLPGIPPTAVALICGSLVPRFASLYLDARLRPSPTIDEGNFGVHLVASWRWYMTETSPPAVRQEGPAGDRSGISAGPAPAAASAAVPAMVVSGRADALVLVQTRRGGADGAHGSQHQGSGDHHRQVFQRCPPSGEFDREFRSGFGSDLRGLSHRGSGGVEVLPRGQICPRGMRQGGARVATDATSGCTFCYLLRNRWLHLR